MSSEAFGQKIHKDLDVWNGAIGLTSEVYPVTSQFPKDKLFGLVFQARRAAVAMPCNIAQAAARNSRKEHIQFLYVAFGFIAELETQLLVAARLKVVQSREALTGLIEFGRCCWASFAFSRAHL